MSGRRSGSVVDGFEPRIRELLASVSADAGDGDRGADRLAVFDPHVERPGGGAAAGVSAAGPGEPDGLCRRGGGAVRFLVPRHRAAGRVRPDPDGEVVAGADDGVRLFAVRARRCWCRPGRAEDLYAGWWRLIAQLGAVPRVLVWDGEGAVGRWRARRTELTANVRRSAARWAQGDHLQAGRPGGQGAGGTLPRLPGALVPARPHVHLAGRLQHPARRVLGAGERAGASGVGLPPGRPVDADKAAMLALPPVPPATGWRHTLRLPRDHYVRMDGNDYSVHPAAIGRRVEIRADLDRVRVMLRGQLVADHERIWAKHQTITDPAHLTAARRCAAAGSSLVRRRPKPRWRSDPWPTTTPRWASRRPDGGRPDGHGSESGDQPRPGRRAGLLDPGVESADVAGVGGPAGRAGPGRVLDP